eukprot:1184182-Prorocentrum_minimum.AAC.3
MSERVLWCCITFEVDVNFLACSLTRVPLAAERAQYPPGSTGLWRLRKGARQFHVCQRQPRVGNRWMLNAREYNCSLSPGSRRALLYVSIGSIIDSLAPRVYGGTGGLVQDSLYTSLSRTSIGSSAFEYKNSNACVMRRAYPNSPANQSFERMQGNREKSRA